MPVESFELSLVHVATHMPIEPGTAVVLSGAYRCRIDGSVVDAVTTRWPDRGPSPSGDKPALGGLVDLEAGGLVLTDHDAGDHIAKVVATGGAAPGCDALGVSSPCLVLRSGPLAHQRLLTVGEWTQSLEGGISVQYEAAPGGVVEGQAAIGWAPTSLQMLCAAVLVVGAMALAAVAVRRWLRSARWRLSSLIRQTGRAARRTNPVLAKVLAPALSSTARAVRRGQIDPSSGAGRRLEQALCAVHRELRVEAADKRRSEQRRVADELLGQVEVALQAAAEASAAG
jgi:hypothetical protein